MKKPVIEFLDFSFQYRAQSKPTLNNINLTIYEGEKVLIVGPSGSGKSTISNCINGLVPFSYKGEVSGSLKINGKETKSMSIFELSKIVGTVLQDPDNQFIGLTVGEDIAFKLENNCVTQEKMKEKVKIVSNLVGINKHLDTTPNRLSGGQKQRVTLAGVMVDDIDILLFDEPLANLDPASGKNTIELIHNIQKKTNKTVIIIEHRLEDILHCPVDRIIVITEGKITADISPANLLGTSILSDAGIREPLYITALKYAECKITPAINPENIDKLDISLCSDKLKNFFNDTCEDIQKISTEPILELKDVKFSYSKDKEILHGVSFKINKGDMVSIVGKNGAGKSTISKLVCGFYKPTSGEILFNGEDLGMQTIKKRAEKIGMVMQNPNQMISKIMIFDEIALGLRSLEIPEEEIKERVFTTLKICGLYEFRNWPISALSYGQKKRVTIASILVLNPELIILDEPTAGQDFKHYTEIMNFLETLNKNGVTIIIITHDMHLMLEYTQRTIVLSDGLNIADDITANILTDDKITKTANLKRTSLYELAIKANLKNPRKFVKRFIDYDRRFRKTCILC